MLPGPNFVYKCPNCGNLIISETLMSGNTFGAKMFSDGKQYAPMLPTFPDLTKCQNCEHIFWLSKLEEIGTYEWGESICAEWENANYAEFPEIGDYLKAIDQRITENNDEEFYIRQRIWWAYNDRLRSGQNIFNNSKDEQTWIANLEKILDLLDENNIEENIKKAEIYRNLGDFET